MLHSVLSKAKKNPFGVDQLATIKHKTPYLLINLATVEDKYRSLRRFLPLFDIHYAVKSNSCDPVISKLKGLGSKFEIASNSELDHLLRHKINPRDIIYSNPVKAPDQIARAYKKGVTYFAFDSVNELQKIAKNAPAANVYLRIIVSDSGSSFPLSSKFGTRPSAAVPLLGFAEDLGLKPRGLTFHVGSQSENDNTWEVAIESCGKIFRSADASGIKLDFLDIGGGLPANYGEPVSGIEHIAKLINRAIKKHIPGSVRLTAEPGRFLVAESGVISASVIGRELRGGNDWLFLDIGVFQGLIEPLEIPEWKYPLYSSISDAHQSIHKSYTLTGPTCDAYDTITHNALLPTNIKLGDKVYIGSTGAYTLPYASSFNGFKPPKVYYI